MIKPFLLRASGFAIGCAIAAGVAGDGREALRHPGRCPQRVAPWRVGRFRWGRGSLSPDRANS